MIELVERFCETRGRGDVALVVRRLSRGDPLSSTALQAALIEVGYVDPSDRGSALVRFALGCVEEAIHDHRLGPQELADIQTLKRWFRIPEGEILRRSPRTVERAIQETMRVVLHDHTVDEEEARYKVELQAAFDLGYDEFMALCHGPLCDSWDALALEYDKVRDRSSDEMYDLSVKMVALGRTLGLSTASFDLQQIQDGATSRGTRHIPQAVRDAVWRRDRGSCVQCGTPENLEFDHIIPHSRGGANTYRNVQLLCEPCNRRKSDKIGD